MSHPLNIYGEEENFFRRRGLKRGELFQVLLGKSLVSYLNSFLAAFLDYGSSFGAIRSSVGSIRFAFCHI
ncbi:MAG: hypothetical protein MRERV_53c015 [Mycoplasmataceae bacterium RV_VA103A]|nr:MAG: hypothetical protein MRERV_53c015 [Mycoplasmataceae bacterium RV_VA103A]